MLTLTIIWSIGALCMAAYYIAGYVQGESSQPLVEIVNTLLWPVLVLLIVWQLVKVRKPAQPGEKHS